MCGGEPCRVLLSVLWVRGKFQLGLEAVLCKAVFFLKLLFTNISATYLFNFYFVCGDILVSFHPLEVSDGPLTSHNNFPRILKMVARLSCSYCHSLSVSSKPQLIDPVHMEMTVPMAIAAIATAFVGKVPLTASTPMQTVAQTNCAAMERTPDRKRII